MSLPGDDGFSSGSEPLPDDGLLSDDEPLSDDDGLLSDDEPLSDDDGLLSDDEPLSDDDGLLSDDDGLLSDDEPLSDDDDSLPDDSETVSSALTKLILVATKAADNSAISISFFPSLLIRFPSVFCMPAPCFIPVIVIQTTAVSRTPAEPLPLFSSRT